MHRYQIETIVHDYFQPVYRFIYFRVGNTVETEDIVGDIFEKVVRHIHDFHEQDGATLRSWIFTIARHALIDYYRKKRHTNIPIDAIEIPVAAMSDAVANLSLNLAHALAAIDQLPSRQKEIVLLRHQAGLSNKEIAGIMQIGERTVAASLSRALKILRQQLAPLHL
ncbi:MAG: RNA polymerase sigma factor [Candidatus Kerfeldbacteria bacterium]|nr:RNA polymerase sigma factor [Candidatus Kerfeldbacteria bacterium]